MAHIISTSDRLKKTKLISRTDIYILSGRAAANEARENFVKKYEQLEKDKKKESTKPYPDVEYIARIDKKLIELRQSYLRYKQEIHNQNVR